MAMKLIDTKDGDPPIFFDDESVHCSRDLDICEFIGKLLLSLSSTSNQPKGVNFGPFSPIGPLIRSKKIAKGTTDPRVKFYLPKQLLQVISQVFAQILTKIHLQNID